MNEKPIIFKEEMVRAILSGGKTQTRRVINAPEFVEYFEQDERNGLIWWGCSENTRNGTIKCRYGKIGDRLWVRENFNVTWVDNPQPTGHLSHDEDLSNTASVTYPAGGNQYCRDLLENEEGYPNQVEQAFRALKKKTSPSIHMPRWASRLTLEITDIRIERLNDISEMDAIEEGIAEENVIVAMRCYGGYPIEEAEDRFFPPASVSNQGEDDCGFECPIDAFRALWNSITNNWDSDPWVWVVEFKKIEEKR